MNCLSVMLEKVSLLERAGPTESFSVWLHNEADAMVAQGTYRFDHKTMGRIEMFVVSKTCSSIEGSDLVSGLPRRERHAVPALFVAKSARRRPYTTFGGEQIRVSGVAN